MAFSHSALKDKVGVDALRSVLHGRYRDIVYGGMIHLQPVWELLEQQPGFDAEAARPPFAALKSWQDEMQIEVELPTAMAAATATEIMAWSSHCPVPRATRRRALAAVSGVSAAELGTKGGAKKANKKAGEQRRPSLVALLAFVAVLGLGFAGYTIFQYIGSSGEFEEASLPVTGELPVTAQKRLGSQLSVQVADEWFDSSEDERNADLEEMMSGLQRFQITTLVVQDQSGAVRGSAQWFGVPPKLVIRLD
jgi:hypothetical protein